MAKLVKGQKKGEGGRGGDAEMLVHLCASPPPCSLPDLLHLGNQGMIKRRKQSRSLLHSRSYRNKNIMRHILLILLNGSATLFFFLSFIFI